MVGMTWLPAMMNSNSLEQEVEMNSFFPSWFGSGFIIMKSAM